MHKMIFSLFVLGLLSLQVNAQIQDKIDSLLSTAKTYVDKKPQVSYELAAKALEQAKSALMHEQIVEAYILIARHHLHNNASAVAIDSLYSAIPSINSIPTTLANQLLSNIGKAHMAAHNDTVSFMDAITDEEAAVKNKRTCELLLILIDYYINNNNLQKAADFIERAALMAEQVNDEKLIYAVLQKRGIGQFKLNYISRALESFERTLDYYTKQNDKVKMAEAQRYLGEIYYIKSEYRKSETLFKTSLENDEQSKHNPGILKALAKISLINERFDESIKFLTQALQLHGKNDRDELFYLLAGNHFMKDEIERSKQFYDSAIANSKADKNYVMLGKSLAAKAKCYSSENDFKNASYYLKNAYTAAEESYEQQFNESIIMHTAFYNSMYQDTQIDKLRKEQEWQDLQLRNSRTRTYLLLVILIAALLGLSLLIYFYIQKQRFSEMQKEKNAIIDQSNQELQAINQALNNSQMQLLKSNQVKDRMFSIITHDVKGALISIREQLEPSATTYTKNQVKSNQQLINNTLNLINQHINWAVTQSDKIEINREAFSLKSILLKDIDLFSGIISKKKLSFNIGFDETVEMLADIKITQLILRNLLSNAIKHSPDNNTITINYSELQNNTIISINDNGPGIPQDKADTIFSKHQDDNTKNGSGLFLSNRFAKAINGKLWFENNSPTGCTFYFSIPV